MNALVRDDASRAFDLSDDLMLRVSWLATGADTGVLLFNMHHIASDGWSMQVLSEEFVTLYNALRAGRPSPLKELAVQYADYSLWQRDYLRGEVMDSQLAYWQAQLADAPVVHSLPLARARGSQVRGQGARLHSRVTGQVVSQLEALAGEHQLTPFMVLHGVLAQVVSRHSGTTDVVIGTPVANRLQSELAPLLGCFVNTLVLRVDTARDDYLAHVRDVHLGAQAHQDIPFEQLVEQLSVERSTQHNPLVQIMLSMNVADVASTGSAPALDGVTLVELAQDEVRVKFELQLDVHLESDQLHLSWTWDTGLFDAQQIQTLDHHFTRLLESMVVGRDDMLSEQEMQHLVHDLNRTEVAYPQDVCMHELFEAQVRQQP
ncbi:condensation domain-containing protein, partial [Rheinheimera pacifica]|uniref:condensation domain-containing protein n=1 Tax=Rheinheimera pacifica TaxID=173990 RepID=UPI001FE1E3EF